MWTIPFRCEIPSTKLTKFVTQNCESAVLQIEFTLGYRYLSNFSPHGIHFARKTMQAGFFPNFKMEKER